MEELVDILTETGDIVGKSIKKLDAHNLNVCHGISAVALINLEGKLLIQKKSIYKKNRAKQMGFIKCWSH